MDQIREGTLLWQPTDDDRRKANLTHYMAWLEQSFNLAFENYPDLWQWSVDHAAKFWQSRPVLFQYCPWY